MIHVMNFKGDIIDYISRNDNALIKAVHHRNINDRTETFDFTILSERTTYMQERNRIIIQDKNGQYREFIIDHISQDINGYTEVETVASYLEDIAKAKPYAPHKFEKMTTRQALSDVLKDTGWSVSDQTEHGGVHTTSWTSYQTRYEVLLQLCTSYKMMADFYIQIGSNSVENRYVVLRKRQPLFNGKEITYGKDLTGLKRVVDYSEVKTALLCVGPEKESGKRIELIVKDDDAQARIGLPGRYNWGIYEPETDDENMTEARLRTLGTTELNKRKKEAISYEVTALDIQKAYSHEVVNLGDMIRIKNRDFTPALYVEAEVISEEYDMIAQDVVYGFGEYIEYKESELRDEFTKKLEDIRNKLNDTFSNINTIVKDSVDGELQYFERKIIKSATPPENPVNDTLWLDISNPDVPILKRYWNGEWIKASVDNVEQIGGVTREKALFSELKNTFVNLSIQHSKLLKEMYEVITSEYLVDEDLKQEVNSKLDATIEVYNQIKANLESMTEDTATIGKLIDTQALFLTYRERIQDLYNSVEKAKLAIDRRFKLLQSQYTDEKFNEALNNVASKLGLTVNEDNQLVGEVDVSKQINEAVREMTNEMLRDYVTSTEYQSDKNGIIERLDNSDSERKQLSNQIADRVTRSEYENDVEQRLVNSKAEVLIEAEQTSNRVSKEVFNANSKSLERYTSEFINNVSTGMSFIYDDNGNIQSANVGPQGIQLNGDKINLNASRQFNLLVSDMRNKVDKNSVVSSINASPERIDINTQNIGLRGGDSINYLEIKNNRVLSRGNFTRTWANQTDTANLTLGIRSGHIIVSNEDTGYNLYVTEKGLSTMMNGVSGETAGTLEFHYEGYNETSRGVRLHSTYGAVALESDYSRIYTVADLTNNIESRKYGVYIRPFKDTRAGLNEFQFYVKDNDSVGDTDGAILYDNLTDDTGIHGSGIRFSKSSRDNIVYATNRDGDIGTGDFYANRLLGDWTAKGDNVYACVDDKLRVTDKRGYNNGDPNYKNLQVRDIQANSIRVNTGANFYLGVTTGELRVTNNLLYNGGSIGYKPVRASAFNNASLAEYKKDIKLWNYDALSVITNDLELYQYKYKDDSDQLLHRGVVIGDGYATPSEFIFGDGVNLYEMLTWSLRAIQQ
ncbi:phage tail spike protein [Staphylococcus coagulans]|uniref:phage tail spike protein n=1 Tax=Staphylococcus coagulans TaxID=74706 RepID=UPI0015F8AC04|nr:phage tail spike protein [Staphylococcus coagulans]MBA8762903.1 hypothetical protein [Staphylococcus coagulans]